LKGLEKMGKSAPNFENIIQGWQFRLLLIAETLGLNKTDIAKLVEREPAAISAWFKENPPNIAIGVLAKICSELKISCDYILFDKGSTTEVRFKVLIQKLLTELDKKEVIDDEFLKLIDTEAEKEPKLKPVLLFVTDLMKSDSSPETIAKLILKHFDTETRKQVINELVKLL